MSRTDWAALEWRAVLSLVFIVVGSTFLSYLLVIVGQKRLRPTVAGMYNYIQPLVACIVAVCWGLDRFNLTKALSVVLIFRRGVARYGEPQPGRSGACRRGGCRRGGTERRLTRASYLLDESPVLHAAAPGSPFPVPAVGAYFCPKRSWKTVSASGLRSSAWRSGEAGSPAP
ncbi:membrane protein containing DUF6, transmembrane [human gut metagenome]|uniref:Membrane protein containing DUF6, transmembrane n=1 Tax=human gut metagenome TaxID=408170 RepID=K1SYS6_9ZZZZ